MCVKLPSRTLALTPHTPQTLILVDRPSHQGYVMVKEDKLKEKNRCTYLVVVSWWTVNKEQKEKIN